ncbi:putative NTP pyrophosphohydrolase [Carnobacterium sp. 17-4]|uniref:NUDIX hydrolase n=1 Tax=Carnobacterium sp. (strain 17-4) TaxID=208596 RepID=UPI00020590A7|nr:NUDIX domain-containing protein [Carnobacterium sp. 17-4]AEB30873.1 putative NTP pyrophosphohydrolase [Carnobacterium sp. 17-4]
MDYIPWIRNYIGNQEIILNFSGGIITNQKKEILLQLRSDKKLWGLPGGAVEKGESVEQTAIREVLEETALHVEVVALLGVYSNYFDTYPNGDKAQTITTMFIFKLVEGNLSLENSETLDLGFFSRTNLPEIANQQHRDAIKDYFSGDLGFYR